MKKLKNFIRVLFAMIIALALAGGGEIVEAADPNSIVIWEVYGGGGNSWSEYANDYVVLKNISDKTQSVDGMYLHKGTTSVLSDKNVELSGTIRPGGYYVFAGQEGQGFNSDMAAIPYARKTDNKFDLSATNFTVTLTNGQDASKESNIVDMLGAGKARNFREEAAAAPSNTDSLRRKDFTGNNRSDFELINHNRSRKLRVLSYLTEENTTEGVDNDTSEDASVTIDPNGGEIKEYYAKKVVPVGKTYKVLPRNVVDLKRDGYKFNGYDVIGTLLDKDGNKVSTIDYLYNQELRPVGNVTLKARWVEFEGGKVSFEFKFDDGSQFDSKKYQVLLVNLDDQSDIKILQSKNRTKTATGVKAGKYSVKVSGLANDESVKEFTKGSAYGNSGSTSSVKYIDGKSGELTIEFDEEVTDPKAYYYINLEKINISQTYELTFDYQNENQANKSSEVDSSLPVAINSPEAREGYKFLGYDVEGKLLDSNKNEITERFLPGSEEYFLGSDVKLTAVWQELVPEESVVTIDPNGGEINEAYIERTFKKGELLNIGWNWQKDYGLYKDGYHFDAFEVEGTLLDEKGNKVTEINRFFNYSYTPVGNVTLKVRWKVMQGGQFRAYVKREDDTDFSGIQYKLYLKGTDTAERKFPYGVTRESQTHKMSLLQLKNDIYTLRVEGLADDEFIKEVRLKEDKYIQNQADTKIELKDRDKAEIEIKYDSHFIAPEVNFDVIIGKKPVEKTYTLTLTGEGIDKKTVPGLTRKIPINLNAVEREGYKFIGWEVEGTLFDSEGNSVTGLITNFDQSYYPGSDVVFTAVWEKVIPEAENASLIIYEVFGGGGKTGSLYANDYVVIKNTGDQPVNLDGMVLRKGISNRWTDQSVGLSGELAPDAFYVVSGGNDNEADGGERPVPAVNIADERFNFANRTFSLALTTDDNLPSEDNTIDLVGTGKARNFEGKQAATGRNNVSLRRINDGQDTDNNREDFARVEHLRDADSYPLAYLGDKDLRATVTFAFNKEINGVDIPEAQKVEVGSEITLPKVSSEVKNGYSFLGWVIGDNKNATANLKPGDKITVEEDTNVMGIWEGAYGKVAVTFHENEFINDNFENLKKITKIEDTIGFGFSVTNKQSGEVTEGKKTSSKGEFKIANGLVKGTYTLDVRVPEGYEIVAVKRNVGDSPITIANGDTITLPRPEVPFNLTMVDSIYVEVKEKEEEKATVTFEFDQNIDGAKLPDPITVPVGTKLELPSLDEEVLGEYSFMGWELNKSYPNKADANPGDTITVTEDMTVKGYWEGRIGRFSVHFHEGPYEKNISTLTDGFGFTTINPRDNTRVDGVLAGTDSKTPYFITPNRANGGGLTKGDYDFEFKIPEGYKIVSIKKHVVGGGFEEVNIGDRIDPYWYPFNLSMQRDIYVQVEKEEPAIELPEGLYIYEIYGGGGLQQSYYANDYVVLQNKSDSDIDLSGINLHVSKQWRPEYAYNIPLSGTIKANDFFVIKAGAGFKSGEQKDLPRVDLDLSGGKLYQNDFDYQAIGLALTKGAEDPNEANTIDKVGTYRNNQYLVRPAVSPHVDRSIRRVAYDDINKTDFEKISHRPYIEGTAEHREPLWYLKDSQEEKVTVSFAHNVELKNNETPAEQNVWSGTKITLPEVKEEEKYEFKGWDVDGDGIADKQAGEEFEVKDNVTITGIWEEIKPEVKTINFVVDPEKGSATGALSAEVIEGEDPIAKAPKVEAKEGYNFVRWEASEDGLTYTAIFEEVQKPVKLIRDRSIRFEVKETISGRSELSVKTSKAGDVVVIEINGQEVIRKASNEADVFEVYELNRTVKLNDKISVYIIRDKQYRSSKINNIINN